MLLYSTKQTPRLHYISGFIGKELIGQPVTVTDNRLEFENYIGPKINYSAERITNSEYWIVPHSLLFENTIQPQSIDCFEVNGNKAFFKTTGDFPFDIFSAAFYLLSRYEEYLSHEKDEYGRYDYKSSLAYHEGFLNQPLVNKWIEELRKTIRIKFANLQLPTPNFTFLPTYDIDEAYAFLHKPLWRRLGGAVKDLLKGEFRNIAFRKNVLQGKKKDPYDSYEWMNSLHEKFSLRPVYFFLLAEKTRGYDKNNPPNHPAIKGLIKQHALQYSIGIHPSWHSGDEESLLWKEKKYLEEVSGVPVTKSRQHYIRFTMPGTFRKLISAGITEDYSMGYGSINGFRASVASPFCWYDLEKEEKTTLQLFPFCYMDANSFYEQKYTAEEALDEMLHYYKEVKNVNGLLITLWHNNFLGGDSKNKHWRAMYVRFIKELKGMYQE
jgi:hypothetical protein